MNDFFVSILRTLRLYNKIATLLIKTKAMKIKPHITIIPIMISVIISLNLVESEFTFNDEPYINDIPFNTEIIFDALTNHEFVFEEEDYINDIPFNTFKIATNDNEEVCVKLCFGKISDNRFINQL